ncbi:cholesterol 24-hydroxylase isoform X2 [Rhinatrema bivittatum]|uniref:cholesterol 24-hydroxylase isoform X2 n=1 Tax=Rhinatrema bivittatum TaxID=194408 RepID=UPI00112844CB|nr:cholesterol 24-hydroxylase isoform X2 [Rhinatrema bivittatum]
MAVWAALAWLLLGAAVLAFLLYCAYVKSVHLKYDHIPGPPRHSFLLGHWPLFVQSLDNSDFLLHDHLLEWTKTCGPLIRLNIFHKAVVFVLSPEAVKEYLMSPKYTKDVFYNQLFNLFGVRFLGRGLVTDQDYDHWHKQRRVMDPAFSRTYLTGLMGIFNEKAEDLTENLMGKADGRTEVRMHDLLSRVTLDVIAKAAFGLELNALHDDQTPFPRAVSMAMKGIMDLRNPFIKFMPGKRKYVKEVQESVRLLRQTGVECIERRKAAMQRGEDIPTDILTQILKGAGQETTAGQLAFAVMELARHPEIMEKVRAEVDEVIGSKRDIDYEDLGKLKYLSQILKETLRLYPVAPGTSRWLEDDAVIEEVKVPAQTALLFSMYIMGRMDKFFPDPLTFNPDRFSSDAPRPYFTYFPFSLGPRSCIGQVFAQMEAKVVMAKLVQRFEFRLVAGQSFKILDTGSLRPLDGVICRLKPREDTAGSW